MKKRTFTQTNPPYSTIAVANFFIDKGVKYSIPIDHLKIQQFIYLTHCDVVLQKKKSMLDEEPQAWKQGPVFVGVYHRFKYFDSHPIEVIMDLSFRIFPKIANQEIGEIMESIWNKYQSHSTEQLQEIVQEENKTWRRLYDPNDPNTNRTITVEEITKMADGSNISPENVVEQIKKPVRFDLDSEFATLESQLVKGFKSMPPQLTKEFQEAQVQIKKDSAIARSIQESNIMRFAYSNRSFWVTIVWITIIVAFLLTQIINSNVFAQLCESKYIATVVSLSAIICGFWAIVGKGLFGVHNDTQP
ncbi:MAG: Panacea domain-containing protein [Candidatus Liberibacter asiaticus]|uniref:Panacea domain-containing protein n=1 Tax=Liberibacter asiaticus TaxID=34021 RepID=UPI0004E040D1|nr:type II toxin-antitoxin system antitoxin SocA domain-containing protein [Candidatus Liberibacter asiaticus]BAP26782.1 phage-associated protein [Candidatus Liberibacter asiaticus str. Ishi-1]